MNNPDHISESFETIFRAKILKFFNADPGWKKFGSRIRDGKHSDPGSGINIPDPQHYRPISMRIHRIPIHSTALVNWDKAKETHSV
jgi:hypothetical protein